MHGVSGADSDAIMKKTSFRDVSRSRAQLCTRTGCRFHYTTVPADGSVLIPQNKVGYTGCLTNLPDGGFTDNNN